MSEVYRNVYLCLSLSLSLCLPLCLSASLSLSVYLSLRLSLIHTHTHTLSHTHFSPLQHHHQRLLDVSLFFSSHPHRFSLCYNYTSAQAFTSTHHHILHTYSTMIHHCQKITWTLNSRIFF